ncbi:hypothetical protein JL721_9546 [Aureococcus anophagefferens]|nr:hypothetical protein JL721_9546 [Aureococcus anophagefferens]
MRDRVAVGARKRSDSRSPTHPAPGSRHKPTQSNFSHGGTKLDTREKRTLPQLLTLAKDEVVARKDAEIAGLREELAALKGDGSDMTGLPAVLRDFTPLAMVDDVAAIADGPELDWY